MGRRVRCWEVWVWMMSGPARDKAMKTGREEKRRRRGERGAGAGAEAEIEETENTDTKNDIGGEAEVEVEAGRGVGNEGLTGEKTGSRVMEEGTGGIETGLVATTTEGEKGTAIALIEGGAAHRSGEDVMNHTTDTEIDEDDDALTQFCNYMDIMHAKVFQPSRPVCDADHSQSAPSPPPPKFPTNAVLARFSSSVLALHPPEIHRDSSRDEGNDDDDLHWLRKDCSRQQEDADAAEDDRCGDPGLVWSLQIWLADSEDNEAEHGEEVEGVGGHARKGDQGTELADDDVGGRQDGIRKHGIDGCKA